jgi:hypothetical protein
MTTVAIQLIIESGRALGAGAKESEALHIIPIIFVSIASKAFYIFFLGLATHRLQSSPRARCASSASSTAGTLQFTFSLLITATTLSSTPLV